MASERGDGGRPPGSSSWGIIASSFSSITHSLTKLPGSASRRSPVQLRERLQPRQSDLCTATEPASFLAATPTTSEPSSYHGLVTPDSEIQQYQNLDESLTPPSRTASIDPSTLFSPMIASINTRQSKASSAPSERALRKAHWALHTGPAYVKFYQNLDATTRACIDSDVNKYVNDRTKTFDETLLYGKRLLNNAQVTQDHLTRSDSLVAAVPAVTRFANEDMGIARRSELAINPDVSSQPLRPVTISTKPEIHTGVPLPSNDPLNWAAHLESDTVRALNAFSDKKYERMKRKINSFAKSCDVKDAGEVVEYVKQLIADTSKANNDDASTIGPPSVVVTPPPVVEEVVAPPSPTPSLGTQTTKESALLEGIQQLIKQSQETQEKMVENGNAAHLKTIELLSQTLNNKDKVEQMGKEDIEKQLFRLTVKDLPAIPDERNQRSVHEWFESMQRKLD